MRAMALRRDANSENVAGAREPSLFLSKEKNVSHLVKHRLVFC